jgi:hypothetical protein
VPPFTPIAPIAAAASIEMNGKLQSVHRSARSKANLASASMLPQKMEFTSLSDGLINLIPIYGPWIIFGIVAFESAGVPLPGETVLAAAALLAATTDQINIVVVVLAAAAGAIVGDGMGHMVGSAWCTLSSQIRSVHPPR